MVNRRILGVVSVHLAATACLLSGQELGIGGPHKAKGRHGTWMAEEQVGRVSGTLREAIQAGAQRVRILILLREQPHVEVLERYEQPAQLMLDILEARLRQAASRTVPLEQEVMQAQEALEREARRVRAAAFEEIRQRIGPDQDSVAELATRLGARNVRRYAAINMLAAEVPSESVETIASHPAVAEVSLDEKHRALLDVSAPSLGAPSLWSAGYTGAGQAVAVIDTGLKATHPAFAGLSIVNQVFLNTAESDRCFADNWTSPEDMHGHGTHVAGIVASRGSPYFGIARALGVLYNLKAAWVDQCQKSAATYHSDVLDALDWLMSNAPSAKVINYSLGGNTSFGDTASARAWDYFADTYGLIASISAGNEGPASGTVNTPAIAHNVIAVAAMATSRSADRGDDTVASFSSRGPTADGRKKPDLAAPGTGSEGEVGIYSADYNSSGYIAKEGTSMAAPHVAGAAALLRQAGVTSPLAVKALLINSTDTPDWASDRGWGYVNLTTAFDQRNQVILGSIAGTPLFY